MPNKTRFSAACAAALLAFALLFSVLFLAAESDHHCTGEHCTICRQIQSCQTLLEHLSTAYAPSAGAAALCFFAPFVLRRVRHLLAASSPVLWKVKLLN